jgi:hypothetical protein
MRVDAPPALASLARLNGLSGRAAPADGKTFSPQTPAMPAQGPQAAQSAMPALATSSMAGLLALQSEMQRPDPRQTAITRGRRQLDLLEGLKLALLEGEVKPAQRDQLRAALEDARPEVDDAGLADVLDQIDLRLAVELAKLEPRANRGS